MQEVVQALQSIAQAVTDNKRTFRTQYQSDTVNSTSENNVIKRGWGYIQGNGTAAGTKVVTFPTTDPFTSAPTVQISQAGFKNTGVPTSPGDATGGAAEIMSHFGVTTTGFTARYQGTAAVAGTAYILFHWEATGPI
jgi:hypothetical protein